MFVYINFTYIHIIYMYTYIQEYGVWKHMREERGSRSQEKILCISDLLRFKKIND